MRSGVEGTPWKHGPPALRHVSAGWGDGIRTMVRRTQSRALGGSRVYKWSSGAGKTEIPAEMEPGTTIGLGESRRIWRRTGSASFLVLRPTISARG